jgi:DNA polymerase-3 subunit beta
MEIKVNRKDLSKALAIVIRTTKPNSTLPVLAGVSIEAYSALDSYIFLTTYDNSRITTVKVKAEILVEGKSTVRCRHLANIINVGSDDEVTLAADSNSMLVKVGVYEYKLSAFAQEEIPHIQLGTPIAEFDFAELLAAVKSVWNCASPDEARPGLMVINFDNKREAIVTTDGFRVAERKFPLGGLNAKYYAKAFRDLSLIFKGQDRVKVCRDEGVITKWVTFYTDDIAYTTSVEDAEFPPYERIIPRDTSTKIVINTAELLSACTRSQTVFYGDDHRIMKITIKDGALEFKAEGTYLRLNFSLPVTVIGEKRFQLAVNPSMFADGVRAVYTPELIMGVNSCNTPILITPTGDDPKFRYVLMPMHIG